MTGDVLMGVAGQPASLNGTYLGGDAISRWEFVDIDGTLSGQVCTGDVCDGIIRDNMGNYVDSLKTPSGTPIGGVFSIRAGGGRVMARGPNGIADSSGMAIGQDRNPIAVADDGLGADVNYNDPKNIRLTLPGGELYAEIVDANWTWSNGDDYRAFIRDGILSHSRNTVGWQMYDITTVPPRLVTNYVPWPGGVAISWLVPVRDRLGVLWLLERHERYLTLRQPVDRQGSVVGYFQSEADALYDPDVRRIGDDFKIVWSGTPQENPEAYRVNEYTLAELKLLDVLTFENPTTPTPPSTEPGPEPPDPPDPPDGNERVIYTKPGDVVRIIAESCTDGQRRAGRQLTALAADRRCNNCGAWWQGKETPTTCPVCLSDNVLVRR